MARYQQWSAGVAHVHLYGGSIPHLATTHMERGGARRRAARKLV